MKTFKVDCFHGKTYRRISIERYSIDRTIQSQNFQLLYFSRSVLNQTLSFLPRLVHQLVGISNLPSDVIKHHSFRGQDGLSVHRCRSPFKTNKGK